MAADGRLWKVPAGWMRSWSSLSGSACPVRRRPGRGTSECSLPSLRTVLPVSLSAAFSCAHTSLGDLVARALLGRLAVQDPRLVPLGDVHGEAVDRDAVAVVRAGSRAPASAAAWAMPVSDQGESMKLKWPLHHGRTLRQIELDARHPVRLQLVAPRQLRVGRAQRGAPGAARVLHRHGLDVVVGGDVTPYAVRVLHDGRGDAAAVEAQLADGPADAELDAQGA